MRQLALTPTLRWQEILPDTKQFDVVLVECIVTSGQSGFGDALIVEGTTPETLGQAWAIICTLADASVGMDENSALALYRKSYLSAPHAVTAIINAVEMAAGVFSLTPPGNLPPISIIDGAYMSTFAESPKEFNYNLHDELRIILTGEVRADLLRIDSIRNRFGENAMLRLEGDQAFTEAKALEFVKNLEPTNIKWLSQPCVAGDWEASAKIRKQANVPIAVSGFVYGISEIAALIEFQAADLVGLHSTMSGGWSQLHENISTAKELGLGVFVGGALQSDLANHFDMQIVGTLHGVQSNINSVSATVEPILTFAGVSASGPRLNLETLAQCTLQELKFTA